jgi:hypothetical protein
MKRAALLPTLVLVVTYWLPLQPAASQEYEDLLELRAYPYADLLIAAPSYPYDGQGLPTVGRQGAMSIGWGGMMGGTGMYGTGMYGAGMGGMGMGGMGMGGMQAATPEGSSGAGGGGTGGAVRPEHHLEGSPLFNSPEGLIQAIQKLVAPETWEEVGGAASVTAFGGLLLVSQTPENHEKLDDFFETIRSEGATARTVIVEARWLLLDGPQLDELLGHHADKPGEDGPLTVDPGVCDRLCQEVPGYRGRITCFSGQTVHVASGNRRNVVISAIPVVGSGIGYQPILGVVNAGVLLQVTPSLLPGTDAAILDVQSTVTGPIEPEPIPFVGSDFPATERVDPVSQELTREPGGSTTLTLDRLDIPAQQLATALRVPLDEPVLVGGLTLDPTETAAPEPKDANRRVLYLIVQVSAAESGSSD